MYVVEKYVTNNRKKNYKMETFSPETFFWQKSGKELKVELLKKCGKIPLDAKIMQRNN